MATEPSLVVARDARATGYPLGCFFTCPKHARGRQGLILSKQDDGIPTSLRWMGSGQINLWLPITCDPPCWFVHPVKGMVGCRPCGLCIKGTLPSGHTSFLIPQNKPLCSLRVKSFAGAHLLARRLLYGQPWPFWDMPRIHLTFANTPKLLLLKGRNPVVDTLL